MILVLSKVFKHCPNDLARPTGREIDILLGIEYLIGQKFVGQKCRNFSLVSKVLSDETFCPSKLLSNISIQNSGKIGQKFRNFGLVSKILSDEIFCPSKILSDKLCCIPPSTKGNLWSTCIVKKPIWICSCRIPS